ncbi:MAG: hypothetical protein IPJ90_04790 [Anaerolineaceae bacterium]|nr:hypothetical protein [Anaerolineaceae bacterium]
MHKKILRLFVFLGLTAVFTACGGTQPYTEPFDAPGSWRVESSGDVTGEVRDGVFDFTVNEDELTSWTTAGESFSNGIYTVEATQVAGPDNNAYGMLFRVDDENDNFYSFQISGDGYVWIGRYRDGGAAEAEPIVNDWWFESPAINQGNATNKLAVQAEGQNLIFFVNDQEVGRVTDDAFSSGDIGLMVRTLGVGGVQVQFDNFTVEPLP